LIWFGEVEPVDGEFAAGDEFGMDEQGRLELSGAAGAGADDEPASGSFGEDGFGWPDAAGDLDRWQGPDDEEEAWLRSLPADVRAEVLARPPVTVLPWEAGPAAARASFADGGLGDGMVPGRLLGELLAEAALEGYRQLSDDEMVGLLRGWQRQIASGQCAQARLVAELMRRRTDESRRPGWAHLLQHVSDEVAVELTLTGRSAGRLCDVASGLARLDAVSDALRAGLIDWARACVFVDELAVLDDDTARPLAERYAGPAAGWTTGQLRAALARAVIAADPAAAGRRKTTARKDTRVELWREDSGNAALAGRELRPASAIALDRKLDSDAAWLAACGVPGTRGELRALAYTTLLAGRDLESIPADPAAWPQPEPGGGAGRSRDDEGDRAAGRPERGSGAAAAGVPAGRPEAARHRGPAAPASGSIHLTMPVSAWLGSGQPGEVAGFGPIDAAASRELAGLLAADPATRWCLTLTRPDGTPAAHACAGRRGPAAGEPVISWAAGLRQRLQILEYGTCSHARKAPGYVPPGRLRHLVTIRQPRCCFPGCRQPAHRCDLDHTIPFDAGGLTCECNLAPACRRHHQAKQAPGWRLSQNQPGLMTWRPPSGRAYRTVGDPYPV
jgi:hypothetical protein